MRARIEVADQLGAVALFVDLAELDGLRPRQRGQLDTLAAKLVSDLSGVLGCGEDHARSFAIAEVARLAADEAAYERVAARRGLLPL